MYRQGWIIVEGYGVDCRGGVAEEEETEEDLQVDGQIEVRLRQHRAAVTMRYDHPLGTVSSEDMRPTKRWPGLMIPRWRGGRDMWASFECR